MEPRASGRRDVDENRRGLCILCSVLVLGIIIGLVFAPARRHVEGALTGNSRWDLLRQGREIFFIMGMQEDWCSDCGLPTMSPTARENSGFRSHRLAELDRSIGAFLKDNLDIQDVVVLVKDDMGGEFCVVPDEKAPGKVKQCIAKRSPPADAEKKDDTKKNDEPEAEKKAEEEKAEEESQKEDQKESKTASQKNAKEKEAKCKCEVGNEEGEYVRSFSSPNGGFRVTRSIAHQLEKFRGVILVIHTHGDFDPWAADSRWWSQQLPRTWSDTEEGALTLEENYNSIMSDHLSTMRQTPLLGEKGIDLLCNNSGSHCIFKLMGFDHGDALSKGYMGFTDYGILGNIVVNLVESAANKHRMDEWSRSRSKLGFERVWSRLSSTATQHGALARQAEFELNSMDGWLVCLVIFIILGGFLAWHLEAILPCED